MIKTIYFVGIHNKPNKKPLDSTTRSGKIIDEIIQQVGEEFEFVKCNLFPVPNMPRGRERQDLLKSFDLDSEGYYIVLGKNTGSYLLQIGLRKGICFYHPGYAMRQGKDYLKRYQDTLSHTIKDILHPEQASLTLTEIDDFAHWVLRINHQTTINQ